MYMNLREDINRIKEVMGINESRDMFFRRRRDEFLDVLLTSFEWMDEFIDEMDSFEVYLDLILIRSIDGLFEFNDILVKGDDIEELLPLALSFLRNDERLFRKIKDHYYSKKSDTTITESNGRFLMRRGLEFNNYIFDYFGNVNPQRFDSFKDYLKKEINTEQRMNESRELLLVKRRMDALLDYVEVSYDFLSPSRFKNFDDFLERVIFSATRDFVTDKIGGEHEEQLKIREELEPMIMELVKKHPIYDEIYDHYISNLHQMNLQEDIDRIKQVRGINEESVNPYLKRRMPELIAAAIQAANWYVPSFMPDFNTYLDRVIYSGIVSVIPLDYADTHVPQMNELENGLRNLIYDNKELLNKFKELYYLSSTKYKG